MQKRPLLTKSALQHFATDRSYESGTSYYMKGAVGKVTYDGTVFTAYVQGSELYIVRLRITNGRAEKHCSCAYAKDSLCKHAVAVALAVINGQYGSIDAKPPVQQSAETEPMLYEVEDLLAKADERSKSAFLRELLAKNAELRELFIRYTTQYPTTLAA